MSHEHHHHDHSTGNISVAFVLNAVFVVIELVGGLITNSIAILSDALHDFGDCLSLAVAWALQKKSRQGPSTSYSYGYKRFSLLGSIFLSGILFVSSLCIIYESAQRIITPQAVSAPGMLWLAIIGITINGAAALRVKRGSSLNERAVYLHILEDVLGWIAVLIVSIVMLFVDLPILDPLLSLAISVWVLSNAYRNLRAVFRVLLQGTPRESDMQEIRRKVLAVPGVADVHDLHIWSLDGEDHVMTLHVVTTPDADPHALKQQLRSTLAADHITHLTIEVEYPAEPCTTRCN